MAISTLLPHAVVHHRNGEKGCTLGVELGEDRERRRATINIHTTEREKEEEED